MTDEQSEAPKGDATPAAKPFDKFLTSTPPDVVEEISDVARYYSSQRLDLIYLATSGLLLHCDSEQCHGERFFRCTEGSFNVTSNKWEFGFIHYACRNCRKKTKIFSIAARRGQTLSGSAMKLGETPPFGPHTPARVITLIGPDRELFLQGRRAENRGMGIGAFSYYRRVVENQKGRIISEIARVAQKLGAKPRVLEAFKLPRRKHSSVRLLMRLRTGFRMF
jgi:hypothetical protein